MSVQSPQQEGGNCHTGPVPPGQQPSHQDIREALVLTVSDPSDHHICMTAPARDVDILDSLVLWQLAAAAKISSPGLPVAPKTVYLPQDSQ